MSGGTFNGDNYRIHDCVDTIVERLKRNSMTVQEYWDSLDPDERASYAGWYESLWTKDRIPYLAEKEAERKADEAVGLNDPNDFGKLSEKGKDRWNEVRRTEIERLINEHNSSPIGDNFSEKTVEAIREMLRTIRLAAVYLHRIDYLFAGDDGEKAFLERVKEDVKELDEKD